MSQHRCGREFLQSSAGGPPIGRVASDLPPNGQLVAAIEAIDALAAAPASEPRQWMRLPSASETLGWSYDRSASGSAGAGGGDDAGH
jgi:hypothetical protein